MTGQPVQEFRFAIRSLLRGGAATLVAVLSLAVGIAANTTIFSLVQQVEFPSLPYPDSSALVFLESRNHARGIAGMLVSMPDAADVIASARTYEVSAIAGDQSSILREAGGPRRVTGRRVTAPFFDVLRLPPSLGRWILPGDGPGVIVLGDTLWRSQFAADPAVVGRTIRLDGGGVVVLGVMPPRFDPDAEFWVPLTPPPDPRRDDRQFSMFARLARGVSVSAAADELSLISRRLAEEHPGTNANWEMYPVPLARLHGRDSRQAFLLLQAAVAFLLLIACANIANILLARATNRRQEMAIRLSLGATRARLVRMLLAESVALSSAGGVLGVLLAMWGIRVARAIGGFPDVLEPEINAWAVGFTATLCMFTAAACGVLPALQASAVAPNSALQGEGRTLAGGGRGGLRAALVSVQIGIALVLVTCGALMVQSLLNRARVDLGFDPRGAVRADVPLPPDRYQDPAAMRQAVDRILDATRRVGGVIAAGASTWALPTGAGGQRTITVPGDETRLLPTGLRRAFEAVTPDYFSALGMPILAGRDFTSTDRGGSAAVAIVNDELARQLFGGQNPVGRTLRLGTPDEGAPIVTIVGVVGNVRRSPMHEASIVRVYVPYAQHPNGMPAFVVRSRERAEVAIRQFEAAVRRVDSELLVEGQRTVADDVARFVAPVRLVAALLTTFATLGLLLAALGVFGAMSYAVTLRRREIAVRSALGATRRDILGMVLGTGVKVTVVGVLTGAVASVFASRALAGMVFGVDPFDPLTFAASAALLSAVAVVACYRPALAAASVDPLAVLRQ